MNYFQLFNIPTSFVTDASVLRQKFYELSRKYHPDFFTQETEGEQLDALEMSSQVNKAYKVLQNREATIQYLLQQKDVLEEDEKYQLPPDFLMDMMELNEQLQDAKHEGNEVKLAETKQDIAALQEEIYTPVQQIIETYDDNETPVESLQPVKEYYFKKKYIDRILATIQS